jgi:thiamine-monophosphate kinase
MTRRYNAAYLGGDLGLASEAVFTGIGVGTIHQGDILTRRNAHEGDYVCVTGYFGITALGFDSLLKEKLSKTHFFSSSTIKSALAKIFEPELRLNEGRMLSSRELASASIDSSDGLASSLNWLSKESNVKIIVDYLPTDPMLLEYEIPKKKIRDMVFFGGEEFELVFTIPPSKLDQTINDFKQNNLRCLIIGKCFGGKGVFYKINDEEIKIPLYGWDSIQKTQN